MTLFLASVKDAAEAEFALRAEADIIDLKNPANGALGAVAPKDARAAVDAIAGRVPVSMTVGDLPMAPARIHAAVLERAACGADYIKLGLFPGAEPHAVFERLRPLAAKLRLVVVVFADCVPDFDAIAAATELGAAGIMLDTMNKGRGALSDHIAPKDLANFVTRAKRVDLAVGLAGSLRMEHVPGLLALKPDLLGFRGALCRGSRSASIDSEACLAVRALIPKIGSLRVGTPPMAEMCAEAL
jgi:uncharacterized protein (UPF0264 family)